MTNGQATNGPMDNGHNAMSNDKTKMANIGQARPTNEQMRLAVGVLRRITIAVKVTPFIYALATILAILGNMFIDDTYTTWLDLTFYVSPLMIAVMFANSYILKFCNWHRLECALPLIPLSTVIVDEHICQLPAPMVWIGGFVCISILLLSIVNAYFVFVRPTRTRQAASHDKFGTKHTQATSRKPQATSHASHSKLHKHSLNLQEDEI